MSLKMNEQGIKQAKAAHIWERTQWIWSGVFLASVVISLLFALQSEEMTAGQRQTAVILSFILVIWYMGGMVALYYRPHFRSQSVYTVAYMLVIILLWFLLVRLNPAFFIILFGLFSNIFWVLLLRWAIATAVLLMFLTVYQQTAGVGEAISLEVLVIFVGMTTGGILLGIWIHAIISQSMERKALIEQLEITQSELAEAEREAGVLQERQRLAREIHDTLAQGFISIVTHLEAAEQALGDGHTAVTGNHVSIAKSTARDSLKQARRVVDDLRPEPLEQATLPEAISHVAAQWQEKCGITAVTQITGIPCPLHPEAEVTLLRAAQEALTNVGKHAQASQVQLTLSYMGDTVILDVQDDGVGMNGRTAVSGAKSSGYGLTAMRERISQLGGHLLIESEPGEGTTLVVDIPIGD